MNMNNGGGLPEKVGVLGGRGKGGKFRTFVIA